MPGVGSYVVFNCVVETANVRIPTLLLVGGSGTSSPCGVGHACFLGWSGKGTDTSSLGEFDDD